MKKTFHFILELFRIIFILFILLFGYSFLNTFLIEALGGFELIEGTNIATVFFLLQTAGILLLITIIYRNKLQFSGWYTSDHLKPFSKKRTQIFLLLSVVAIGGSYLILLARMLTV
ncbi:hypothetical protein CR194_17585 [Salipaludibacillus keqinensis]|uniref:Uncharacterized protein n=1 Tax=Salipaludibacillus keqinensis TaxID=2045207 RepID=A0A323T871_9BACI|nr:hypothetical protein [Salipaludibacillus keqinensis]PYZ92008.1 hypothetical protein CR194_17585 [Salipaludibacillus keqinensis]